MKKLILVIASAVALSGCVPAFTAVSQNVGAHSLQAAEHGKFVMDAEFALAATTDEASARQLCAEIEYHKAGQNAAWDTAKQVGGGVLRFGAALAAVAGFPVAAAIDAVVDGVDAVEGFNSTMQAATATSDIRCARLSGG